MENNLEKENKIYTLAELQSIFTKIGENVEEIKKIILFGSYARGEANQNSDIDLYIICHQDVDISTMKNKGKVRINILKLLSTEILKNIDIVISNDNILENGSKSEYYIEYYVKKEGIVLYEC